MCDYCVTDNIQHTTHTGPTTTNTHACMQARKAVNRPCTGWPWLYSGYSLQMEQHKPEGDYCSV